jgi:ketosteroid isomerase-like protein
MGKVSYTVNLALLIALLCSICSRSDRAVAAASGSIPGPSTDTEQVRETFARYMQAFERKDLDTLGKIFTHDEKLQAFWPSPANPFRVEGWNDMRRGLAGYLPEIGTMAINIRQPIIQTYGSMAIVSCHWSYTASVGGRPQIGSGRGSYIFEKRDGEWFLVHLHESALPVPAR